MTRKHKGGRGRKAPNKHETVTISLPPHLKAVLDAAVTPEVSRSELVADLIDRYLNHPASKVGPAQAVSKTKAPKAPAPTRTRIKAVEVLPEVVTVNSQTTGRGLKWKPEKYAVAERLLAEGFTIQRMADSADYQTEKGNLMSWRTVQALLKRGVLVPAMAAGHDG